MMELENLRNEIVSVTTEEPIEKVYKSYQEIKPYTKKETVIAKKIFQFLTIENII